MPAVSFQTIALQAGIKLKLRGNVMTDTVKGHFLLMEFPFRAYTRNSILYDQVEWVLVEFPHRNGTLESDFPFLCTAPHGITALNQIWIGRYRHKWTQPSRHQSMDFDGGCYYGKLYRQIPIHRLTSDWVSMERSAWNHPLDSFP